MHRGTSHISDDTCVDLILGQLPAADSRETLEHLARCKECENRFRELARQWELAAVRATPLVSSRPTRTRSASARKSKWAPRIGHPVVRRWLVPAAAAAVVLAMVVFPRLAENPSAPMLVKFPPLTGTVEPRTVLPPQMSEDLLVGIGAYDRDDFAAAIEALERVDADGPLDGFRRVYLANALAWSGRYADAAAVLDEVPFELVPEPWSSEAQWTLYCALSAIGDTARAEALLRKLRGIDGPVGDRARAMKGE